MILSLKEKIVCFLFILFIGMMAFPTQGRASAVPCFCPYGVPTYNFGPAGTDICECTTYSYCEEGSFCCMDAFPAIISMDLFEEYRATFIMDEFYTDTVEPDFQQLADEMRSVHTFRIAAWGAFLDASIFNDTLKDLGVLTAQSIQSYTPSEQICKFGSLSTSLAASEARVDNNRIALSENGLMKNLGTKNTISSAGNGLENESRIIGFIDNFCSLKDNNSGLEELCDVATPIDELQHNRDIDYTRLMGNGTTINADLTDTDETLDEYNLFAMSHFLYGHRQPSKRISLADFSETPGNEELYQEYRSVTARRAAAQNSFNTLAAMKMAGSGESESYIRDVLSYIGISGATADAYLGAENTTDTAVDTSYNEQMNLLSKQIYQDPAFYSNLMDSKTNVKRTSAALQGIGLMQGRDTYKSMARSEMLMAILVELEARKQASNVQATKTGEE